MKKPDIVFLDAFTMNPGDLDFSPLYDLGNCTIYDRTTPEELSERVKEATIIIVNKFLINEQSLAFMPHVKYICVAATGYNNIDIAAVREKNIPVSNVRDYSTESVVQHVFASILTWSNKISYYDRQVKSGRWSGQTDFCFYDQTIPSLRQKTIGIAGYGSIGKRVADVATAFGMKVVVYTRSEIQNQKNVEKVSLESLFQRSDILTLHMPLTAETKKFVRKEHLNMMKPGSVIINTARGPLVDADDVYTALESGVLAAAFLDVWETEPPAEQHPLMEHPNCIMTPHIAWAGIEARQNLLLGLVDNIQAFLDGKWIHPIYEKNN
ncbi:MAG: D-2-hydroxyacid dehydrogenase [Saprospiraceae bacterium]|nr:D-2-hydroxyacid dehydrogenase [Saprospiraceae bacterium]